MFIQCHKLRQLFNLASNLTLKKLSIHMKNNINKEQESELLPINFIDLKAQQVGIRAGVNQAIARVLDHGRYVNGPEVHEFEQKLVELTGAKYVLSCANGTDALTLVLLAKGIKAGDAVFVPSFTFAASAEVIAYQGATPIFVDVNKETFTMDLDSLERAILLVMNNPDLNPKAILTVDLFGVPANYDAIQQIAEKYNLWILSDAAQSFGASYKNKKVGCFGLATTTSFFPSKPLGCYGDGGCIFTNDEELATEILYLKSHGQGDKLNHFVRIGQNSRLDSFQAAILLEKLKVFPAEIRHRQSVADTYAELLSDAIKTPQLSNDFISVWAQYTITLPESVNRTKVINYLKENNIPTVAYYETPLHKQPAYAKYKEFSPDLPNTEYLSKYTLSLPMDGYLSIDKIRYIAEHLNKIIIS